MNEQDPLTHLQAFYGELKQMPVPATLGEPPRRNGRDWLWNLAGPLALGAALAACALLVSQIPQSTLPTPFTTPNLADRLRSAGLALTDIAPTPPKKRDSRQGANQPWNA